MVEEKGELFEDTMLKKLNKKGLGRLLPAIQILVIVGILMGLGVILLNEFRDQAVSLDTNGINGTAAQTLNSTASSIGDFADWLPIIVIGIAAMILLSLVIGGLMSERKAV